MAYGVAIQSDEKIVVAGYYSNAGNHDFLLIRFNSDGSLDASFDFDGIVTSPILSSDDQARAVAIQNDQKIIAAGHASDLGFNDFAIVRCNVDGSLDVGFGVGGIVTTAIGSRNDQANGVAIQSNQKIVVVGYAYMAANNNFAVVRYNVDGTLDVTFSGDGIVTTAVGVSAGEARAVAIQSNQRIVVVGRAATVASIEFAVVRYDVDGSLDLTFSGTGMVMTTIHSSGTDEANAVAIQPSDQKIVVAGRAFNGVDADFGVVRYNTDGTLDLGFAGTGIATMPVGVSTDFALGVAIQSDGKIVMTGSAITLLGANDIAVVRYNSDGTIDATFGSSGIATTAIGPGNDIGNAIAIQSDGKIVVAGSAFSGSSFDIAVVRYIS